MNIRILTRRLLIGGLLSLLGGSLALGQSAEDILRFAQRTPAINARTLGMSGANIAGFADWSAMFSNPAGLGHVQYSQFSGGLNSLAFTTEGQFSLGGNNASTTFDGSSVGLANVGYIAKQPTDRGSLVYGVGYSATGYYNRNLLFNGTNSQSTITEYFLPLPGEFEVTENNDGSLDLNILRDLSFIAYEAFGIDFDAQAWRNGNPNPFLPFVEPGTTLSQNGEVAESGRMGEINLGGAIEVAPDVMVGASANISIGSYNFERQFEEVDVNNENDGTNGTADFDHLDFRESFESSLAGVNLRAGISADVSDNFRIGAVLETPTFLDVEETFSTRLSVVFDDGFSAAYGGSHINGDVGTGNFTYSIQTPWRFGLGGSYEMGNLLLSADLEWVDWSQARFSSETDEAFFDELNQTIRQNFTSVMNVRLGGQYQLGDLSLRAGVAAQPDPRKNAAVNGDKGYASFGVGYTFNNQFELNFGWMVEAFEDQYRPYAEVDNIPVITEEVTRNHVLIGVRVKM